jgi:hypothetical protein
MPPSRLGVGLLLAGGVNVDALNLSGSSKPSNGKTISLPLHKRPEEELPVVSSLKNYLKIKKEVDDQKWEAAKLGENNLKSESSEKLESDLRSAEDAVLKSRAHVTIHDFQNAQ